MADRPILFIAPMVRGINREVKYPGKGKTQTRRGLKIKGHRTFSEFGPSDTIGYDWHFRDSEKRWHDLRDHDLKMRLPWQVGDRLWVRETWAVSTVYDRTKPIDINPGRKPNWCGIRYAATDERIGIKDRTSIHMPRWASRFTLIVTDVRVQRLQDISLGDCIAEGAPLDPHWYDTTQDGSGIPMCFIDGEDPLTTRRQTPVAWYHRLWDRINGIESWDANPWVVALTFTVEQRNIDEVRKEIANG